jgi:arylsulfatase A-like enzyme
VLISRHHHLRRRGLAAFGVAVALAFGLAACTRTATHEGGTLAFPQYDSVQQNSPGTTYAASQQRPAYEGTWEAKAHFGGVNGGSAYARGVMNVNAPNGYDGYYGAAFYLPTGTLSTQTARFDIMRWDNFSTLGQSGDYGGIAVDADHRARLVRGQFTDDPNETIGKPFTLQEGCWNWLTVHQRLSQANPTNEVYLNGTKVVDSQAPNNFGHGIDQVRYGLVSTDSAQLQPLDVYVDNPYISSSELIPPGANACDPRPNVLFIVTDDQHPGESVSPDFMPHTVDLFKNNGTFFPQGFVSTPLCCPSRATMLTGLYAHNHGQYSNDQPRLDLTNSLPRYLHDAGYETGMFGKFLNEWNLWLGPNPANGPTAWDKWAIFNSGYSAPNDVNEQGVRKSVSSYSTTYVENQALSFLQNAEQTNDGRPWFLYLAPYAPHIPSTPETQYANTPVPDATFNPARDEGKPGGDPITDKPPYVQGWGDPEDTTAARANEMRTLQSVDDMVNAVFQSLDDYGEDRDTIAFFVSDNGRMWREHGLTKKGQPYTESIEVPFYMRWRGRSDVKRSYTDNRLVANVDMAPTVMDALKLTPPSPMDGMSLLDPANQRSRITLEWYGGGTPPWGSIRTDTYQYTEYYDSEGTVPTFREYYNLANDPYQLTNLLNDGDPSNDPSQETLDALHAQLHADRLCRATECPPFGPGKVPADDTQAPEISFATPLDGDMAGGTTELGVRAYDNIGVAGVQYQLDGTDLGPENTSGPFFFSQAWDTTAVPPGSHTLKAIARDAAGNTTETSQTVVVGSADIQICDPSVTCGPNPGRRESGDTITYLFPDLVNPTDFFADWDGSGTRTVTVRANPDDAFHRYNDTITVTGLDNPMLGTIDLGLNDYAGLFNSVSYPTSTLSMDNDPVSPTFRRKVTLTLGGGPTSASNTGFQGIMIWTPGPIACTCDVTESGYPIDREF